MADPIHEFFGLSYANYLVVNRSVLQSMPEEWQASFVALAEEMEAAMLKHGIDSAPAFTIRTQDLSGRFIKDPIPAYDRGRTRLFEGAER